MIDENNILFELEKIHCVLLVGAGHGIGLSVARKLLEDYPNITKVFATYRMKTSAQNLLDLLERFGDRLIVFNIDPSSEDELEKLSSEIDKNHCQIDLLINCVGCLEDSVVAPEKNLSKISVETLLHYFKVNSIITPLLAKMFYQHFRRTTPTCFAVLSAKVGSIGDNRLGGWYGYRASKAALNMFLKNISIEFKNRGCQTLVLALHPGTTDSALSKKHLKTASSLRIHQPDETAQNMLNVISRRSTKESGRFLDWQGQELPW